MSNFNSEENLTPDKKDSIYDGKWEKGDRSIITAAFVALILIGAVYFNLQSIIITVIAVTYKAFSDFTVEGDSFERIIQLTEALKIPILITLLLSQIFFMCIPSLLLVKRWHSKNIKEYIRLRIPRVPHLVFPVLITLSVLPLVYKINEYLIKWVGIPEEFQDIGSSLFSANNITELIIIIIVVAITPAFCEEIFFRGQVQRTLERKWGFKTVLIVGFIFGLYHMQPLGLINLSILGILFSWFYYKSKSLIPSMIAHFINNFVAVLILYLNKIETFEFLEFSIVIYPVSFLIFITLIITYQKFIRK